jgi:transposase
MVEEEVSALAARIRRQQMLLSSSSSKRAFAGAVLAAAAADDESNVAARERHRHQKQLVMNWKLEKQEELKKKSEMELKRRMEIERTNAENERKDRKARQMRILERERKKREKSLEALREKENVSILKEHHSPLEALARRKRDMDFARHRYEMKTKETKEKEERDARIARAAEKFRPKVFGCSVLRAETICTRERMKAKADPNEAAKAKAESWFLPTNSVIK